MNRLRSGQPPPTLAIDFRNYGRGSQGIAGDCFILQPFCRIRQGSARPKPDEAPLMRKFWGELFQVDIAKKGYRSCDAHTSLKITLGA